MRLPLPEVVALCVLSRTVVRPGACATTSVKATGSAVAEAHLGGGDGKQQTMLRRIRTPRGSAAMIAGPQGWKRRWHRLTKGGMMTVGAPTATRQSRAAETP